MPASDLELGTTKPAASPTRRVVPDYGLTFVESPPLLASIYRQLRARLREPKITLDKKFYRGEATLPIVEMPAWYRDLPDQLRLFFETPKEPIGFFNRGQEEKRILSALGFAILAAGAWWAIKGLPEGGPEMVLGLAVVYGLGYGLSALVFKKREYPPDIWRDYTPQKASWVNSLLVHGLGLTAILLPFILSQLTPVKASTNHEIIDISPYLDQLAADAKKAGGGGGGGDRSPTPASKGPIPKFAKTQLAPPVAKLMNPAPQMPVEPTLVGPPELKLPQMQASLNFGDPQATVVPQSNGPGFGGGLGTGDGGGIGSGHGGGLGPGDGGGTGGGVYSVGGNVSEPIAIYKPLPPYSEEARKAKYQGTVVLWIIVQVDGSVSDVRVVKPLGLGLDEKAVETVKTWKFKPALRNGVPVPVQASVEVSFRLF